MLVLAACASPEAGDARTPIPETAPVTAAPVPTSAPLSAAPVATLLPDAKEVGQTPGPSDQSSTDLAALYRQGMTLEADHRHAEAMQTWATVAAASPEAAAALWLEVAESELAARRSQEAADAAAKGLAAAQVRPLKQRLLEIQVQALAAAGDAEAAFQAHRQVLALATSSATLGEQLFRLVQVSRDLGKREAAVQALKTALEQFPQASTTPDALRLLDEFGATGEIDPYVLGKARYFALDYRNAVAALDESLHANPDGPDAPLARLYRALASLTPGNEPNALRELDVIADDPNQDTDIAAQALLQAGQALESLAQPDQAELRYERLVQKFPALDAAATAGFRLGLARFVRGADSEALSTWDEVLARKDNLTPDDLSRVLYWRGKALNQLGQDADARDSWQQAAAVRPGSYYSLRAMVVLGEVPSSSRPVPITDVDEQDLSRWLAGRGQDLAAAATSVEADPALARARVEATLGLQREGNWEADDALQRNQDRTDRLYVLARRFAALGLGGGATRLGEAAYAAASIQSPKEAPAALRKAAFPRPYANLSDQVAARYGIDPLLIDATFLNASQFDPFAEDPATGARGLAMMSPVHHDEATHGMRADTDAQPEPRTEIERQAWLVADRLRRFDGRPEVALSALASTDRLVDGWLARPGARDPDVYVESMDYEAVRAAVREGLATRIRYALTYGQPGQPNAGPSDPLAAHKVGPEPTAAWIKIARLSADVPPDAPLSPPLETSDGDLTTTLARAATMQRDGDFEGAANIFQQALASRPEEPLGRELQVRLGQALLAARRPTEALTALQSAKCRGSDLPQCAADQAVATTTLADFLTGRAQAQLGRCDDALPSFERFITAAAALDGPALVAQGQAAEADCLLDLGRAADALALLQKASATPDLPRLQTIDFRERLALARARSGDADGARADYEALLASAKTASYRAELHYDLGILAGDTVTAIDHFRSAVQLDPSSRAAQAALDELVARDDPADQSFEGADTRFQQNRYREALAAYVAFVNQFPEDPRVASARYGEGVALVRLGQDRAGIAALEDIGSRFPATPEAADGLFRAGRIRESLADLDGAAADYGQVINQPNAGSRATDAEFRLAFVRFQQRDYDPAIAAWRDLSTRLTVADDRAQALFWLGKALHATGDEAVARSAWTEAAAADPTGYYGLRSGDLLRAIDDPRAGPGNQFDRTGVDDPVGATSAWLDERGELVSAERRLASDSGVQRAQHLLAMGLRQEAIWELGDVQSRIADSVPALTLLGAWEQARGLYFPALQLGFSLSASAHLSLIAGPAAVRRLAYPLPNSSVLASAASRLHVDPLLFAALMLQESAMDQSAESASQARGLSQLIASNGYQAARALGQYAFRSVDLFQPRTSITLGAFTLGLRLSRYDQQIFPSLAAYNAGEFAVDGWLLAAGDADVDTFAEAIPFTETYPYVQRIYVNYKQYLDLYGAPLT
jgi:soluble lytic murein transglycosylase